MPIKNFRWLKRAETRILLTQLNSLALTDDQETGYILEVDLEYPEHLHESHNSFPLAPEHLKINEDMLSPYAKGE
jgi:hypothetical protein